MRVLLAEDQAWVSQLLAVSMWRAGIETRIAPDAQATVDLLQVFEPHLVLLDATSVAMRASEVCRSIRARSGVPILLVTSGRKLRLKSAPEEPELEGVEEVAVRPADVASVTASVMDSLRRHYTA